MSSATIESTTSSESCLSFCADCSAARWPLTTTTGAVVAVFSVCAHAGLACSTTTWATAAAIAVFCSLINLSPPVAVVFMV